MKSLYSIALALAMAASVMAPGQSHAQFLPGWGPLPPVLPPPGYPAPFPAPRPYYPPPAPYYAPQPYYGEEALGGVCYTSRGACPLEYGRPVGAPCRCFIPGFGRKGGTVGQ